MPYGSLWWSSRVSFQDFLSQFLSQMIIKHGLYAPNDMSEEACCLLESNRSTGSMKSLTHKGVCAFSHKKRTINNSRALPRVYDFLTTPRVPCGS